MVVGGSVCCDWVVLALVLDFREGMLTSPPELAHCGGRGQGDMDSIQTQAAFLTKGFP